MLSLAGRRLTVNQVLMSILWYFIGVWAGSRKVLKQIQSLLRNYLWSGKEHKAMARVAWATCTRKQRAGGLSLIDPHDALDCLMSKWLIKACEPGDSNLLTFLRYRLSLYKPSKEGRWSTDKRWFMSPSHKSAPGSKIWNKAGRAWRRLCRHAHWIKPSSFEEASSAPLWFNSDFENLIQTAFTRARASELHRQGLKAIQDVWHQDNHTCLSWPEARDKFQFLRDEDEAGWGSFLRVIPRVYANVLTGGPLPPSTLD